MQELTVESVLVKPRKLGLRDVRANPKIKAYIEKANEQMAAIGYTEHGLRHAALVAAIARNTLTDLGIDARDAELAALARTGWNFNLISTAPATPLRRLASWKYRDGSARIS